MIEALNKAIREAAQAGVDMLRKSQMSLFDWQPTHTEKHERKETVRHLANGASVQVHNTTATVHVVQHHSGKPASAVVETPKPQEAAMHVITLKFRSTTGKGEVELPIELPKPPTGISFNKYNQPVIGWTPDETVAGMLASNKLGNPAKLEAGRPYDDSQNGQVVEFEVKGKKVKIKTANRPELKELADYAATTAKTLNDAKNEYWRQERDAQDAPALKAMEEKAAELRSQIPKGAIEVEAKQVGSADGDPIMEYSAKGIVLGWKDVTLVGWASAIRPGALAGFKDEAIAYINPEKLKEVVDAQTAAAEQKTQNKAAEEARVAELFATAKTTGKPQVISTWMTSDCMNGSHDCSFDTAHKLVMPDGTIKTEYTCCY